MLKRILNGQSNSITGAAILISSAAFLSRIVGLFRDRIFAHYYAASNIMDAYHAAFKMPDLVYNLLIVGAISAGFIPAFTKLLNSGGKIAAWRLANNILNILGVTVFFLTLLGIIFMPNIIPLLAPGFDSATQKMAIDFGRIMFASMFILSLSMIMGTILQSLRTFLLFSLAPIFYNIGIIAGVVGLVPYFGINGIAWGVVLGACMHFALQAYGAYKHGYRWQWLLDLKNKETILVAKLMIPRTMGLAMYQVNLIVVTILASLLPIGSIAIYNYANNLQGVPMGIIGIPFALAVFPALSMAVAQKNMEKFSQHLGRTINQVLFLIIPLSLIFLLLRAQIVRTVLGSGAFSWQDTITTADTLAFFALGLFAQSLIPLLGRAFYALENTKTPFVVGVIAELIAIIFALILMKKMGVAGLALAFSIGAVVNLILLGFSLQQQTKSLDLNKIFASLWKILIGAIAMALAVQFVKIPLAYIFNQEYFIGIFMQGLLAGLTGLAVYAFICYSLQLPEFIHFWGSFKRRWLHWRAVKIDESIQLKN